MSTLPDLVVRVLVVDNCGGEYLAVAAINKMKKKGGGEKVSGERSRLFANRRCSSKARLAMRPKTYCRPADEAFLDVC